jgi:novel plant SNARE
LLHKADIQYWDDTLNEEIEIIQSMIHDIPKLTGVEKAAALEKCKNKVRAAAGTKRSYKMEIRLVQDVSQRRKFEGRLVAFEQMLKTLGADCKALESESARGELFIEADSAFAAGNLNGNNDDNKLDGQKAGDAMIKQAHEIQNKTQDSLSNTKTMIADSKEVGAATLEELQRQREVLEEIDKGIDRVDDNLARAEVLLKQFGKRMASDHFIQCFAVVNCLLLVGVLVYAFATGKAPGQSTTTETDPTASAESAQKTGTRLLRAVMRRE